MGYEVLPDSLNFSPKHALSMDFECGFLISCLVLRVLCDLLGCFLEVGYEALPENDPLPQSML